MDRVFGYASELENHDSINHFGIDADLMLKALKAAYPEYNSFTPPFNMLLWQGEQGACQGHSLAEAGQINLVKAYGVQPLVSRACGYYESQRYDGINGDKGSTLSGGMKAARAGLCLESAWKYPERYNNARPADWANIPKIKFNGSKEIHDADQIWEMAKRGASIQTGFQWNNTCEKMFCDSYSNSDGGGGHSTLLDGFENHPQYGEVIIHHNSWKGWMKEGRNYWSLKFIKDILAKDKWAVFVAYQPINIEIDLRILEGFSL